MCSGPERFLRFLLRWIQGSGQQWQSSQQRGLGVGACLTNNTSILLIESQAWNWTAPFFLCLSLSLAFRYSLWRKGPRTKAEPIHPVPWSYAESRIHSALGRVLLCVTGGVWKVTERVPSSPPLLETNLVSNLVLDTSNFRLILPLHRLC